MRYEDRDVYEELLKIGLTEEDIDKQFEINVDLKVVLGTDIKQEIEFLKQYNLTEEDIAEISRKNPWILTEDFQRIRFLEKYYKDQYCASYHGCCGDSSTSSDYSKETLDGINLRSYVCSIIWNCFMDSRNE